MVGCSGVCDAILRVDTNVGFFDRKARGSVYLIRVEGASVNV